MHEERDDWMPNDPDFGILPRIHLVKNKAAKRSIFA
jgi:hypothetical protein